MDEAMTKKEPAESGLMGVIERAALDPNVDVDKMERLLAMQKDIYSVQAERAFAEAMTACQTEMPKIAKKARGDKGTMYATLEAVNDSIRPIYTQHGFSLSFGTGDTDKDGMIKILCDVAHNGGHTRKYQFELPLDDSGPKGTKNKSGVQAAGSTISYGRRYLALMIFNLTMCDDNDGEPEVVDFVTPDQVANIFALLTEHKKKEKKLVAYYQIKEIADLPADKYDDACTLIMREKK